MIYLEGYDILSQSSVLEAYRRGVALKGKVVSVGTNLPDGYVLLTIVIEVQPSVWAPHTVPVQVPGKPLQPRDEIEVDWVDPRDHSKGLVITRR